ncbi:MAG: DUF2281 domain-containing protein [Cyanobacteria bacterium J06635_11]
MSPLTQQVVQGIEGLPEASQQQILDFVEFLMAKHQQLNERPLSDEGEEPKSFAEVAQGIIGMGEGPGGLSTNPDYMEGYGQ